ncbi:MAG: GNAT family N-acetyltransferase [Gemmataceae bacterium]|nr:GNAT family N-acetyltransferase [Gemmataceae bacterium]
MAQVEIQTFYVEMLAPCPRSVPSPRDGLAVVRAVRPTVAFYRFFYDVVGEHWNWSSRKKMADAEIAAIIHDPKVEMHVLYVEGVPAGFAELDRRTEGEIELVQFGLLPDFIGQGLGKYFLQWTIDKAWSYQPNRLWLHTCTLDHPAALPSYLKAGFVLYMQETSQRDI